MSVTVDVKTDLRRVLEYFLSPLQQHVQESLRERSADGVRSCAVRTVTETGRLVFKSMESAVRCKLSVILVALLIAQAPARGNATVPCTFENKGYGGGPSFKFVFSKEECRFIETRNGSVVTLSVKYPEMKLIAPQVMDDALIVVRMSQVDVGRFDLDRVLGGRTPDGRMGNIDIYGSGGDETYRFQGKDGAVVLVNKLVNTILANRRVAEDVLVSYQYSASHQDLEALDEAVTVFLSTTLIRFEK